MLPIASRGGGIPRSVMRLIGRQCSPVTSTTPVSTFNEETLHEQTVRQVHAGQEHSFSMIIFTAFILLGMIMFPAASWAFQSHPAPEGLYAHQLAHVIFIGAMGILIYWLEVNQFSRQKGWRLVQASCVLFILWNVVAIVGHWVEEQIPNHLVTGDPDWTQRLAVGTTPLAYVFFVLKLDHLVCVPAMVCLFLGIRALYKQAIGKEPAAHD
jgi:hypothetical protein